MLKTWFLSLFVAVACLALSAHAAFFEFQYGNQPGKFIFEITDKAKITQARDILSGKESNAVHVMGRISKYRKDYNPNWDFHLTPDSIGFIELGIEVCDATIQYIEDHLDEACGAFLPGCYWCPWQSKILREIEV